MLRVTHKSALISVFYVEYHNLVFFAKCFCTEFHNYVYYVECQHAQCHCAECRGTVASSLG
jgi:hypothetical protein